MPTSLPGQDALSRLRAQLARDPNYLRDAHRLLYSSAQANSFDHVRAICSVLASRTGLSAELNYAFGYRDHVNDQERSQLATRVSAATLAALRTLEAQATTPQESRDFLAMANEMLVFGDASLLTNADAQVMRGFLGRHQQYQQNEHYDTVRAVDASLNALSDGVSRGFSETLAALTNLTGSQRDQRLREIEANGTVAGLLTTARQTNNNVRALLAEVRQRRREEATVQAQLLRDRTIGEAIGALQAAANITGSRALATTVPVLACAARVEVAIRSASTAMSMGGLAALNPIMAVVASVITLVSSFGSRRDPVLQGLEQLSRQINELYAVVVEGFRALTEQVSDLSTMIQAMERNLTQQLDRVCAFILMPTVARLDILIGLADHEAAEQGQTGARAVMQQSKAAKDSLDRFGPGGARAAEVPTTLAVAKALDTFCIVTRRSADADLVFGAAAEALPSAVLRAILRAAAAGCLNESPTSRIAQYRFAGALHRWLASTPSVVFRDALKPRGMADARPVEDFTRQLSRTLADADELCAAIEDRNEEDAANLIPLPELVRRIGSSDMVIPSAACQLDNPPVRLGSSTGAVYAGRLTTASLPSENPLPQSGTLDVAVKVVPIRDLSEADSNLEVEESLREINMLTRLRGSNHIIWAYGVSFKPDLGFSMIMELGTRSLEAELNRIRTEGIVPEPAMTVYLLRFLLGLAHAHQMNVVHRDIKPANVILFYRPDGIVTSKLADFGIAKLAATTRSTRTRTARQSDAGAGTNVWKAPELFLEAPHTTFSDTFSAALVAAMVLSNGQPVHGDNKIPLGDIAIMRYYILNRLSAPDIAFGLVGEDAFTAAVRRTLGEPAYTEPDPRNPAHIGRPVIPIGNAEAKVRSVEHLVAALKQYEVQYGVMPEPVHQAASPYSPVSRRVTANMGARPAYDSPYTNALSFAHTPLVPHPNVCESAVRMHVDARREYQLDPALESRFVYDSNCQELIRAVHRLRQVVEFVEVLPRCTSSLVDHLMTTCARAFAQELGGIIDTADEAFRASNGGGHLGLMQDLAEAERAMKIENNDVTFRKCDRPVTPSGSQAHFYHKFGFDQWSSVEQNKVCFLKRGAFPPVLKLALLLNVIRPLNAVVHQYIWNGQSWRATCCEKSGVEAEIVFTIPGVPSIPLLRLAPLDMGKVDQLTRAWGGNEDALKAMAIVHPRADVENRVRDAIRRSQQPARDALRATLQQRINDPQMSEAGCAYNEARNALIVACSLAGYPLALVTQIEVETNLARVFCLDAWTGGRQVPQVVTAEAVRNMVSAYQCV